MSALAFSSVYIFFAEYLAFVSQGLKLKINFHKVLGQGLNWEIVSAFEFNHMLDLDIALLFCLSVHVSLKTLQSGEHGWGACSSYLSTLQERCWVRRVKGWAGGLMGEQGSRLN